MRPDRDGRPPGWWQGWCDAREYLLEEGDRGPSSVRWRSDASRARTGAVRRPAGRRRDVLDHVDGAWAFLGL